MAGVFSRDYGSHVAKFEDVRATGQTMGGALICEINGKSEFIPQGCIDDTSEVWEPGHEGTLVIWEKIAIEKGLV